MLWDPEQKQKFEKSLGQTYLLILENLPERQEATGAPRGDIDTGGSNLGELVIPCGYWCRQAPLWNPPWSLLDSEPSPALAQQPVDTNTGMPQANQLTGQGHSLTHQQTGCPKTPDPIAAPGHSPTHHCTGTRPGTPRALQPELGPGYVCHWASSSPRTCSTHQWAGTRCENWTATYKRMKLEYFLIPCTKINSKCIRDLNLRLENIKLLEENIGRIFFDINCSNIFFDLSPKAK